LTAGRVHAGGAIAPARVNRAPLVVLVGQQDRRHLALEPFLTGRLERLAGDYPVRVDLPGAPPGGGGAAAGTSPSGSTCPGARRTSPALSTAPGTRRRRCAAPRS